MVAQRYRVDKTSEIELGEEKSWQKMKGEK